MTHRPIREAGNPTKTFLESNETFTLVYCDYIGCNQKQSRLLRSVASKNTNSPSVNHKQVDLGPRECEPKALLIIDYFLMSSREGIIDKLKQNIAIFPKTRNATYFQQCVEHCPCFACLSDESDELLHPENIARPSKILISWHPIKHGEKYVSLAFIQTG
ncbi:hypothetical protein RF11_01842 [Thelohanellus kitauei]|uniref:Uncharacterized protein n=1 Tax=Thelohanellus kitauei TaxID=669202 RepID=A0A0C2M7Y8_THEKT|nr:hypothetical protein RF11_01842 [Thelohanellus kitauei]